MKALGDFDASAVIYGKFTTFRPSTGAAFTLAGTPALSVYKDNSTTQSTTGVTLTADFDSVTGLNHFAIDTSADGTFYSAGSFFDIVITTGTVDSVSVVGSVVASFTIRKTAALKPTTAGRALDVSAGGEAGVDWANVGSPTTAVDLSGTTIKTTQKVDVDTIKTNPVVNGGTITFPTNATVASTTNLTAGTIAAVSGAVGSVTGAVGSVTGNVGGNVTGSVGSVTGLTAATVHSDLDDIQARLPAALTSDGNMKSDALRVNGSALAAARMQRAGASMVLGTCAALGTTTSVIASALAPTSAVNDQFNGRIIIFADDTTTTALRGQATDITDYVHATLTFTVTALTTAPQSGDTFVVV
jgi:hypothetical protein